jgi:DNA primase
MREPVSLKLSHGQRKSLEQAVTQYNGTVQPALAYLAQRGIDHETANTYRLGVVVQPMVGHEDYVGKLVIPYLTPAGPVDVRFRTLDGNGPKYLSRPGAIGHLWNVPALKTESDVIAVCEGELDALITDAFVPGIPAVGVPGAAAWKPHFSRLLVDYERVLILTDGDEPGREFGRRLVRELDNAVAVPMPDGMDVNDTFLAEGPDGIKRRAGVA